MTIQVTTEVNKESYEIGVAVGKITESVLVALRDGAQFTDIVDVVKNSYDSAKVAIEGCTGVVEEFKTRPILSSKSMVIPVMDGIEKGIEEFNKKEIKEF